MWGCVVKVISSTKYSKYVSSKVSRATRLCGVPALALALAGLSTFTLSNPAFAARERAVVKIESTSIGKVLFSTSGMALYTYAKDAKNHSNCNGSCLTIWPALIVAKGFRPTGTGVRGLGVIVRSNGQRQVTWNGHPLYRFASDPKGKMTGNGVGGFVAARLGAKPSAATTTTAGGYSY